MNAFVERSKLVIDGENRSRRAFKAAGRQADELQQKFSGLRLGALGLGAAAGVAVVGFAALTTSSIAQAEAIGKVADAVGLTTGELQEYRFAAELSGVETEKFDRAAEAFSRRLGEAAAGTGTLVEFLKKYDEELLVSIQRTSSTGEGLDLILGRLAEVESQTERNALATAAFGRAGVRLTNILRDGTKGLDDMRAEARNFGLVLEDDLIRNAEDAQDAITRIEKVLSTNFQRVLLQLAPTIVDFGVAFGQAAPKIKRAADRAIEFFFGIEAVSTETLRARIDELKRSIAEAENINFALADEGLQDESAVAAGEKKQLARFEKLLADREQALSRHLKIFNQLHQQNDETDQVFSDQQRQRAEALQRSIREGFLRTKEFEQQLLLEEKERKLLEIEEAAFTEEERRIAKLETEATFEAQLAQIRRDAQIAQLDADARFFAERTRMAQDAAKKEQRIEQLKRDAALAISTNFFAAANSVLDRENKKQFKAAKALAIVETVINTMSAAQKQFDFYSELGPVAYVAAAAAIAAGLARVRVIQSQKFKGGGSTSGGSSGSAPAVTSSSSTGSASVPALDPLQGQTARVLRLVVETSSLFDEALVRDVLMPVIEEVAGDGTTLVELVGA